MNKKTAIYVIAICLVFLLQPRGAGAQSLTGYIIPGGDYKEAVKEAREKISESDIGPETESWIGTLKENNIKLKLVFDDEGFGLMVSAMRLAKKLINEGGVLESDDAAMLISLLAAVERLGAPPSGNLKEKIVQRIYKSVNKSWEGIVNTLCGSAN